MVMRAGRPGEVYNIGGSSERRNIDITKIILSALGKPETLIKYVEDRLGHDRRYAIDSSRIQDELGWRANYNFEDGIADTIKWYLEHQDWCRAVSGHDA
jgi:dTDP-glucose 4,6-dehydratase